MLFHSFWMAKTWRKKKNIKPHFFFFSCVGENYWVFDAERQIRGPESIRALGLSVSGIQAALRWGHDSTYDTYFFKSGSYWRFSPHQNRVESAYPRSMQDWSGIPNDVDASFRDVYGTRQHIYLITTPWFRSASLSPSKLFLLVFQATPTLSEDESTGNSIQSAWTRWRAILATSAWIFLAAEMRELTRGESETRIPHLFLKKSFLALKRKILDQTF